MDFKDFNEIDFLTIKTDFILEMSSGAENINDVIIRIKDMNIDYDTMFVTVLKAVETLRGHITEDIIEKVIIAIRNIITVVGVGAFILDFANDYRFTTFTIKIVVLGVFIWIFFNQIIIVYITR